MSPRQGGSCILVCPFVVPSCLCFRADELRLARDPSLVWRALEGGDWSAHPSRADLQGILGRAHVGSCSRLSPRCRSPFGSIGEASAGRYMFECCRISPSRAALLARLPSRSASVHQARTTLRRGGFPAARAIGVASGACVVCCAFGDSRSRCSNGVHPSWEVLQVRAQAPPAGVFPTAVCRPVSVWQRTICIMSGRMMMQTMPSTSRRARRPPTWCWSGARSATHCATC